MKKMMLVFVMALVAMSSLFAKDLCEVENSKEMATYYVPEIKEEIYVLKNANDASEVLTLIENDEDWTPSVYEWGGAETIVETTFIVAKSSFDLELENKGISTYLSWYPNEDGDVGYLTISTIYQSHVIELVLYLYK